MADDHAAVLFDGAAPEPSAVPAGALPAASLPSTAAGASSAASVVLPSEKDGSKTESPSVSGKAGVGRKRVFTFQKRWMHTLPIMERSLPDSVVSGTSMKPRISDPAALSATPTGNEGSSKDVIICMLCDDPVSKRDAPKIWSRVNCRRGRIENHLWSKHPEFMMLLKQKQEAEGDLAVQIFLQSMRDGHCNVRNEIGAGLYAQLHSSNNSGAGDKRALEHEQDDAHDQVEQDAGSQKRAKVDLSKDTAGMLTTGMAAFYSSDGAPRQPEAREGDADGARSAAYDVGPALPAYNETPALSSLSSWSSSLVNKVVVMTGSGNEVMMDAAAHLWSLGASVLITFSDRSMLDVFMSTSLARCPETHEHLGIPRGVMLPLLCEFSTHKQLDDWSRSIAARFPRVHCLINFVKVADDQPELSSNSNADTAVATDVGNAAKHKRMLGSTMDRLRSIVGAVATHCVSPASPSSTDSHCTVVNVVSRVAASSDAVAAWTRSATQDAVPKLLHVNFVEIPSIAQPITPAANGEAKNAEESARPQQTQHAVATTSLLHVIALLCSPVGRFISGSVMRIEAGVKATASGGSAAGSTASGSTATATPESGAESGGGDGGNSHIL